jgi:hypothetical protein
MALAAAIASWFVAKDSASFEVVQMAVAVLLITTAVAIVVFWKPAVRWIRQHFK